MPAFIVNVAEVEFWGTVILDGTDAAAGLELESEILTPPGPAAPVRETVPVPDRPLVSNVGITARPLKAGGGGFTVIGNVDFAPEYDALKVTTVDVLTVPAVAENVADVAPCGTVTLVGTVAEAGEAVIAMDAPPVPAAPVSETVQVDVADCAMDSGLQVRLFRTGV